MGRQPQLSILTCEVTNYWLATTYNILEQATLTLQICEPTIPRLHTFEQMTPKLQPFKQTT